MHSLHKSAHDHAYATSRLAITVRISVLREQTKPTPALIDYHYRWYQAHRVLRRNKVPEQYEPQRQRRQGANTQQRPVASGSGLRERKTKTSVVGVGLVTPLFLFLSPLHFFRRVSLWLPGGTRCWRKADTMYSLFSERQSLLSPGRPAVLACATA